ncbi:site-2 protease family protein [Halalkalicoccus jeotgali]|uniref:Peptidase M50 n=1 Tax=Halalkalicoccus jeotgali (strain DSM 18796 / CECT 7217 / JCM 14584 / KCTC 4019 / B3) TaxID=795797 RepID=D8J8R3_HALJB|nr:site-2 protease family protein [Halalkalicoccus jeotgali]ADJ14248.1 peptidase M50 [Halalkalicoccus jeotgali B3]ELY40510.1 peptidase M50 [Halalkalicoccus jeotgali B3]
MSEPQTGPPVSRIERVFEVYETDADDGALRYYGTPRTSGQTVLEELWPAFRERGYEVRLTREYGEWVLVAEPIEIGIDGVPWTNVVLFAATVVSTLFAGSLWYHLDPFSSEVLRAWPFTLAIMGVLGVHEFGHYVLSRYHRVNASLPYFIPIPTLIGTMGAVIKMKGQIPSRKALFDIGVAGPLAGLIATIVVTVVGLHLPPVTAPAGLLGDPNAVQIELGYPPLLEGLAWLVDQPLRYDDPATSVNPVVIGGWVGMFVTFLNMIPVGQLDGGHILRAILGEEQDRVAAFVPAILFSLAAYLYYVREIPGDTAFIWVFWGVLALVFSFVGSATPIDDRKLGTGRIAIGVLAIVLGLLCFTPVPIQVIG